MWVQVSGMIGANSKSPEPKHISYHSITDNSIPAVYQPSDKPRYFKANKGLLVICIWMCVSDIHDPQFRIRDPIHPFIITSHP